MLAIKSLRRRREEVLLGIVVSGEVTMVEVGAMMEEVPMMMRMRITSGMYV
jgi:hypothetical protein